MATTIRTAIAQYVEREERYQHELQEDDARWEEFAMTGKALTQQDVRAFFADKLRKLRVWHSREER